MRLDLVLNKEERKERFRVFHAKKKMIQKYPAIAASSQTTTAEHNQCSGASNTAKRIQRSIFDKYSPSVSSPVSSMFTRQNWTSVFPSSRLLPDTSILEHIQEPQGMKQDSISHNYENTPLLQPCTIL